ncbi:uncharacterized protein LOC132548072 [Ylistrum balloti]|uniref:uncharacterized protein LOC132548072 n=1 Tax=Ylistrum balloti TaxID=509963 RepID=UPI002905992F|nr:uncharacterized protein LOC132548072 [Ylistrum balloti]
MENVQDGKYTRDREQYIQVHMDNVQDDARNAFNKIPFTNSSPLGFRYDFDSITHYGPYEYAKNASLPTISSNVSGINFGYSDRLSWYDVLKVRALYGCTGYKMFEGHATNAFTQPSPADHYPQWFESSEHHLYNHDQRCSKETSDQYLVTILHNATLMSSFTIPPGNFCVSVDYCIASCYHDSQSYIGLTTDGGISLEDMKSSGSQGHWETALMNVDADQGWRLNVTAHVLSGGDLLALDKVIVLSGQCA